MDSEIALGLGPGLFCGDGFREGYPGDPVRVAVRTQSGSLEFLISQGGFDFVLGGFALEGTYGHGNEFQRWKGSKISGFDQPWQVFLT